MNQGARIVATKEIVIGDNVLIGDDVMILDGDFHGVAGRPARSAPVCIENDVWIASRAMVLKGVVIGRGSIIGAGAIVTKSVPERSFVCGAAATVKERIVS
jgi:acetyltransferase-like isoleucine patch superfamily enzyme